MPAKLPLQSRSPLTHRTPDPRRGIGIYVHIPFCATKCPYCDFNTYSGIETMMPAYVDALGREIAAWGGHLGPLLAKSVFFGGGTPSYLPAADLTGLLATVRAAFSVAPGAEITIEANPDDVSEEKAGLWLEAGVNRVSLGVQSFDDGLLTSLGRRHSAEEAAQAFEALRSAGFGNLSLDLMFGLPGQSLKQWEDSLERAVGLAPVHLSLYGLQLEKGTPLEADVSAGRVSRPDDDLGADMYQMAMDDLRRAGYRQYEISNWAKPGKESLHNLIYWRNQPYLGVGPGAHSSLFGYRFADVKSPRGYMRALGVEPDAATAVPLPSLKRVAAIAASERKRLPAPLRPMVESGVVESVEESTPRLALADTMMMGLRLAEGVTFAQFEDRFDASLRDIFQPEIEEVRKLGLLEVDEEGVRLTERGRLLGNEVFMRFVEASGRIE